ncbi:MAG: lactate racemase domain-containing protein [Dehalococcoidales bacterium]|nr:lactate racemase domain-containing protein [Dehalococcoidales bacterium]
MALVKLPQLNWYGTTEVNFLLPDAWQVETINMAGYNKPALKPSDIGRALQNPIGCSPLKELAKGKKEVVIIFDDMSRVTRTEALAQAVLKELAAAGIKDKQIRFVCALGCHGALTRIDFVKKLGEDIMSRFAVYNHNPFGNCVPVGKTGTYGTPVSVNAEVMSCDLKIALGMVVPHPMSGFGGGGKIILPGVTSFETTLHNHKQTHHDLTALRGKLGTGRFDENPMRLDIEEAATLAGLDFIVDVMVNYMGETTAVFAGALKPAYAEAVKAAKAHYLTPKVQDKDIVIANAFIKANEAFIGVSIANSAVNRQGGDVVLIANAPEGQVVHYLLGPFGEKQFGPEHQFSRVPEHVRRLIVYNAYPDLAGQGWYAASEKVVFVYKWEEALILLEKDYPSTAKVGVYPNSEIQYFTS